VNPHNNVSDLFTLAAHNSPFTPSLSSAPDGWEIALTYAPSGAAFNGPNALALDASGNVFVANFNGFNGGNIGTVSELKASSAFTAGSNFTAVGAAFNQPQALALDTAGNVWVANCGTRCSGSGNSGSVSELTARTSYGTGANFPTACAAPEEAGAITRDASSKGWLANCSGSSNVGSVSELTASSSYATGVNFAAAGAAFNQSNSVVLDASGNAWVANSGGSSNGNS